MSQLLCALTRRGLRGVNLVIPGPQKCHRVTKSLAGSKLSESELV
jgi:hypothetical protein